MTVDGAWLVSDAHVVVLFSGRLGAEGRESTDPTRAQSSPRPDH